MPTIPHNNLSNTGYLKGLDGLRFIGSFVMLLHHIGSRKNMMEVSSPKYNYLTYSLGNSIMTLFFILSGFLITYLLLQEKKQTKTIDIKGFYIRRICRIWPLYYILLIFGITIYVNVKWFQTTQALTYIKDDYFIVVILYFFHMSNFHIFFASKIWALMYYWSLGVEEQFYAFWPWLVKKANNYLKIFIAVLVIKIGLKYLIAILLIMFSLTAEETIILKKIEKFLYLLRFESFAIGGIAALFLIEKKKKYSILFINPLFNGLILDCYFYVFLHIILLIQFTWFIQFVLLL